MRDAMDKRLAELPKDASETVRRSAEMMTNPGLIVASWSSRSWSGAAIALTTAMYFARADTHGRGWSCRREQVHTSSSAVMAFAGEQVWTQAHWKSSPGCVRPQRFCSTHAARRGHLLPRVGGFRAYAKTPAALAQAFPTTPWQGYSQPPAPNHRNEGTGHHHE